MSKQKAFQNLWSQYGRAVLGVSIFGLFLHDIFGPHGYLSMRRTKLEIERVHGEIVRLNKENAELSEEVKLLKSDPHKVRTDRASRSQALVA